MRRLEIAVLGFCLALLPSLALASDHTGDPNWIQDSSSSCWVYNPSPQHDEAMAWEGPCYDGEANGVGTVTWYQYNTWTSAEKGEMVNGVMQGYWIRRYRNGNVDEANWVDGARQDPTYADQGDDSSSGGDSSSSTYTPVYNGDEYMDTLKRQNRENCERAAKGANIACYPE